MRTDKSGMDRCIRICDDVIDVLQTMNTEKQQLEEQVESQQKELDELYKQLLQGSM